MTISDFLVKPFRRGPFWGLLDIIFKFAALVVWVFVMSCIGYFLYHSYFYDFRPTNTAWWLSYSTVLFITSTTLLYTALFVRKDY